jgi:hypothetical protein
VPAPVPVPVPVSSCYSPGTRAPAPVPVPAPMPVPVPTPVPAPAQLSIRACTGTGAGTVPGLKHELALGQEVGRGEKLVPGQEKDWDGSWFRGRNRREPLEWELEQERFVNNGGTDPRQEDLLFVAALVALSRSWNGC